MAPPRSDLRSLPPKGGGASGPAEPDPLRLLDGDGLAAEEMRRLQWRCRRGLLENDLFVERFFRDHGHALDRRRAAGLNALMDLADNDLLDLLLARAEPQGALDEPAVREVLAMMRMPPPRAAA